MSNTLHISTIAAALLTLSACGSGYDGQTGPTRQEAPGKVTRKETPGARPAAYDRRTRIADLSLGMPAPLAIANLRKDGWTVRAADEGKGGPFANMPGRLSPEAPAYIAVRGTSQVKMKTSETRPKRVSRIELAVGPGDTLPELPPITAGRRDGETTTWRFDGSKETCRPEAGEACLVLTRRKDGEHTVTLTDGGAIDAGRRRRPG